jgi:enediyne biosynthesis protein E4
LRPPLSASACFRLLLALPASLIAQLQQPARPAHNLASAQAPAIQFQHIYSTSKIHFILRNSVNPQPYTFETMAGGVALFDYNNDGLLDIFFTHGASIPSLEKTSPACSNRPFRNNGDGTFAGVGMLAGATEVPLKCSA